MAITYRSVKGSNLTATEVDTNFSDLVAVDATKATVNSPVALTGTTTLNKASHGNRQLTFSGASANLTIDADSGGGWTNDDAVEVHTLAASSGVPTLVTPEGKTITGGPGLVIGAVRKGTNSWTLGTTAAPGLARMDATDITSSRALAAADFDGDVIRLNSASVIAITVPTVASLAFAATLGQVRAIAFLVEGSGIPTFAGATSSTTINGTAGTTTVLPLGGAPVRYGTYLLMQRTPGGNDWTLS